MANTNEVRAQLSILISDKTCTEEGQYNSKLHIPHKIFSKCGEQKKVRLELQEVDKFKITQLIKINQADKN